jgi:hypothetical protein
MSLSAQSSINDRASRKEDRRDEIESMKIAYLTRKLDLTPEEAQKFWPIFNQLKKARKDHSSHKQDLKNDLSSVSDKEVEKMVDGEIIFRQQEVDIIKKYHPQFKQVLPIKKVAQLYSAEDEFKRELLEKIKERRGQSK